MMLKQAKKDTKWLILKIPTKIKNSPTKPVVPGKEIAPKQKTIKKTEKIGIFIHIPPKSLISFDFNLSIKHPADKKSAADIIPWLIIWNTDPCKPSKFLEKIPNVTKPMWATDEYAINFFIFFCASATIDI